MNIRTVAIAALLVCTAARVMAQEPATPAAPPAPPPLDTRTQYPPFLANSFFSFNVGLIGYLFTGRQLEPGFEAGTIDKPRVAARVDLFGHYFSKYFSMQGTYLRPGRYVAYRNINGTDVSRQVSNAYAGVTLSFHAPLGSKVSFYGEGGGGVTSRSGFAIEGKQALKEAHYTSGLLGAGFEYHASQNLDWVLGATYLPGRRSFEQPSSRFYTLGVRYMMRPVPEARVVENRDSGYVFPKAVARLGFTTSGAGYGLNTLFSRKIPIFWGGDLETGSGVSFDYQRNYFHTKKIFAFDLGISAGAWKTNDHAQTFGTISGYPMFRWFFLRRATMDLYGNYSLAGPTFMTKTTIEDQHLGARFTFQDFMGVGGFFGADRKFNAEIGIKHFSNGNLFTTNASVKVPLTVLVGVTF